MFSFIFMGANLKIGLAAPFCGMLFFILYFFFFLSGSYFQSNLSLTYTDKFAIPYAFPLWSYIRYIPWRLHRAKPRLFSIFILVITNPAEYRTCSSFLRLRINVQPKRCVRELMLSWYIFAADIASTRRESFLSILSRLVNTGMPENILQNCTYVCYILINFDRKNWKKKNN